MMRKLALGVSVLSLTSFAVVAQEAPPRGEEAKLKHYEVRDLVSPPGAAESSQEAGAKPGKREPGDKGSKKLELVWKTGMASSNQLARYLTRIAEPAFRADESIAGSKGVLRVKATPASHRWLQSALTACRAGSSIAVQSELVRMNDESYRKHVQPLLRGKRHVVLRGAERTKLLRKLGAIKGVKIQRLPRLTAKPMTVAEITSGKQEAFVKDFDVKIVKAKAVATPILGVVRHGTHLRCAFGVLGDKTVGIGLSLIEVHLRQPVPVHTTKFGAAGSLTLELPETTLTRRREAMRLVGDQVALVAVPSGKNHVVAILRATALDR